MSSRLAAARRGLAPSLWLIALAVAATLAAMWAVPSRSQTPFGDAEQVAKVESLYNDIYLYKRSDGYYILSFGARRLHYVESVVNPADPLELPVYYTQSMTAGLAYPPQLKNAAIIGLGGGRTAWYLHESVPEMTMTAVELDPAVVEIADEYFGVRPEPGFEIEVMDGRVYMARTDKLFDYILVDAYRGPFVPFHLLTVEFYRLVKQHLRPGGVAVQNVEPSTMLFDSAVATIGAVFDNVDFYEGRGNIVVIGYDGPPKSEEELRRVAAERQAQYGYRYDLTQIMDRRYTPEWDETTRPLTDDFAPVEYLKAVERHNQKQQ